MALFKDVQKKAVGQLLSEGVVSDDIAIERYIDVRYIGQEYYLRIPVGDDTVDVTKLGTDFNDEHERNYGYATREFPCEMVNLRVTALGLVERPAFPEYPERKAADGPLEPSMQRSVYFDGELVDTGIYKVDTLRSGDSIDGPAVIEDPRSTVVIQPGQRASVDRLRNIHLERLGE